MEEHKCENGDKMIFMNQEIAYLKEQVSKLWQLVTDQDKTIAVINTKLEAISVKIDQMNIKFDELTKLINQYERRPSEISSKIWVGVITSVGSAIAVYLVMTALGGK